MPESAAPAEDPEVLAEPVPRAGMLLLMVVTLGLLLAGPLQAGVRRLVAWRATPGLGYALLVTALDWTAGLCAGGLSLGLVLATRAHDPAALAGSYAIAATVLAYTAWRIAFGLRIARRAPPDRFTDEDVDLHRRFLVLWLVFSGVFGLMYMAVACATFWLIALSTLDLNVPASAIVLAVTSLFAIPVLAGPYIDWFAWIRVHVHLSHPGGGRHGPRHRHTGTPTHRGMKT